MLASDAMTEEVVTVDVEESLSAAVELMLSRTIGSVVVERGGDATGIVTTTDVLAATFDTGEPLDAIPIEDAMSHPLVTIDPHVTVRAAVTRMSEAGIKHLVVTDGLDPVGILTQTDVIRNHSDLLRETIRHEERRRRKEGDDD